MSATDNFLLHYAPYLFLILGQCIVRMMTSVAVIMNYTGPRFNTRSLFALLFCGAVLWETLLQIEIVDEHSKLSSVMNLARAVVFFFIPIVGLEIALNLYHVRVGKPIMTESGAWHTPHALQMK